MCIYLSIQICAATASMSTNQTNQCAGKVYQLPKTSCNKTISSVFNAQYTG